MKTILAALALALGAWLIEESRDDVGAIAELAVLFAGPIVVGLATFAVVRRAFIPVAFALITFAAAYGGHYCFQRAYNGCVGNADEIKDVLDRYRRTHSRYPAQLTDALPHPPCKRCLRGTILRYASGGTHYVISFSDSIVSWETTDQTSWSVAK